MHRGAILFGCLLAILPAAAEAAPTGSPTSARAWAGVGAGPGRIATEGAVLAVDRAKVRSLLDDGTVRIPTPEGSLERFRVREEPVLAPALQRRFPSIRTYTATGIDDPTATARLSLTPLGFSASIRSADGMTYVDPRGPAEPNLAVAYAREDTAAREPLREAALADEIEGDVRARRAPGDLVPQRTYYLALANDPSFSAYYGGTDELVTAGKAAIVNRMNQLYNDDLGIRMELPFVLNFKTAAEFTAAGYSGSDCTTLVDDNDVVLDARVGSANYDIGHLVGGANLNGGGIAGLGVVGSSSKGVGCTGLNPPTGDGYAIDYVAHEIGHQFGGNHTFDGTSSANCANNRSATASVEPGSGTTIMGYAGICGNENLQAHSDPVFSFKSLDEINAFVNSNRTGFNEGRIVTTGPNRSPVVTAPADRTIPRRTPFTLAGTATDPDGDGLVYTWEQNDSGGGTGAALFSNRTDGPLFRVFGTQGASDPLLYGSAGHNLPTEAGRVRSFPDAAQVAADTTDAETGACPASGTPRVECFSEYLPPLTYAGPMHFRLTARDRDATGGGVSFDEVTLALSGSEPFAVTGPAGPASFAAGGTADVTWNVAGTSAAPFSVPNVRIALSTDGGLTFDQELLAATPNDGAATVTLPDLATTAARIRVEAIGNYFFDVSDGNLTITGAVAPTATPTPTATPAPTVPTVIPGGSPTATPTATPTAAATAAASTTPAYVIPTPTPTSTPVTTPTPTPVGIVTATPTAALPGLATLSPDLVLITKRLRPDARGRVTLRVRCKRVTPGVSPSRCRGRAAVLDGAGGEALGSKVFAFGASRVGVVRVRLQRPVRNRLRSRGLKARVRVTVGARTATKRVRLRPIL